MASTLQKLNNKRDDVTASDVADQVEILRNDIAALTKTISDLSLAKGQEAAEAARSTLNDVRGKAADATETARLQAMEVGDQANAFIRNQPATALGIAAGLGFLVGFLGSRK
ncbi:DUF883 domain-containing protein [uncultured Tateyamaria sp.]|uniref:DUF883 family protein n=1 Tax=uncultured Tateyamaria sp. TaxID=455651 RepID=UPI002602775D|nr:DUF883 domain-containing protein [uncultured Tateyamaria sp.]